MNISPICSASKYNQNPKLKPSINRSALNTPSPVNFTGKSVKVFCAPFLALLFIGNPVKLAEEHFEPVAIKAASNAVKAGRHAIKDVKPEAINSSVEAVAPITENLSMSLDGVPTPEVVQSDVNFYASPGVTKYAQIQESQAPIRGKFYQYNEVKVPYTLDSTAAGASAQAECAKLPVLEYKSSGSPKTIFTDTPTAFEMGVSGFGQNHYINYACAIDNPKELLIPEKFYKNNYDYGRLNTIEQEK